MIKIQHIHEYVKLSKNKLEIYFSQKNWEWRLGMREQASSLSTQEVETAL